MMKSIFKVRDKVKILPLLLLTLSPLAVGGMISYYFRDSLTIMDKIEKPFFTPPPFVFIIVWTILYLLMGFASYRIYMYRELGLDIGNALFYYLVQLLLNYLWFFIFFSFRLYGLAFIELIILFIFILLTFINFIKIDRLAGILLIPYLMWVMFAGLINFFIWMKNEM